MRIYNDLSHVKLSKPTGITVGMFDGVHLGHQKLICSLLHSARAKGYLAGLITFFPHPCQVMGYGVPQYLTSNQEKLEIFKKLGLDFVVIQEFSSEIAQTRAAKFVDLMLANLNMKELWIGHDFALGYKREGNFSFLKTMGVKKGFVVHSVSDPFKIKGNIVSSTQIRAAIQEGDICKANTYLGRPCKITGKIVTDPRCMEENGKRTIRGICMPDSPIPQKGMYWAKITMGQYDFMANVNFQTNEYASNDSAWFEFSLPDILAIWGTIDVEIKLLMNETVQKEFINTEIRTAL